MTFEKGSDQFGRRMNPDTDELLVGYAAAGDMKAFESLVQRYQTRVINLAHRFLGHAPDAEDIAQDVFIKCWKNARRFRGKSKFSTWLFRIVINTCLNYRRGKKNRQPCEIPGEELQEYLEHPESPGEPVPHPQQVMETKERERLVLQKLHELPDKQRMALVLCRFEGYSYDEVAELMKLSRGAVESLIFRARQSLLKKLLPLKEKGEI